MKRHLVSVFVLFAAYGLCAQTLQLDLAQAAKIKDNTARLKAFDALAVEYAPQEEAPNSKWQVEREIDPIDDSTKITFALPAEGPENKYGRKTALIIRHNKDGDELFVAWGEYLADNNVVTYRLGKGQSKKMRWNLSSNKTALFYPGKVGAFIKDISAYDTFTIQCQPYEQAPSTAVFDMRGLMEAATPYMNELSW